MGLFDDLPQDDAASTTAPVAATAPAPTGTLFADLPKDDAPAKPSLFSDLPSASFKLENGKLLTDPSKPADALNDLHAAGWISSDELSRRLPEAQTRQDASAKQQPTTAQTMSKDPQFAPRWIPLQPREFGTDEPPMRTEAGQIFLDPTRYPEALKSALAANYITPEDYAERIKSAYLVQQAAQTHRDLEQQAGPNAMANATVAGAGKGLITLGAGIATGAGVSAIAPESGFTSLALVPAASMAAGSTAGEVYDALLPQSLRAAQQLHPLAYSAGDLASMAIPAPIGLAKALKAAQMVQEAQGGLAATAMLAKPAIAGAVGTAGVQGLDKLVDPDARFSPGGIALGGALGVAFAGLGLKSKDYSPEQLADIWSRGANAAAQGLDPTDVLRPAEREVFGAMKTKFDAVLKSGQTIDPQSFNVTAQQMVAKGQGKAQDTEVVGREQGGEVPIGAVKVNVAGAKPQAGAPGLGAPSGPSAPSPPTGPVPAPAPPEPEEPSGSQQQFESQQTTQQAVTKGAPTVVIGAKGEEYPATYAWAPQGLIQPSHTGETLSPNPAYPLSNTRDYGDAAEKDKALATRNGWDPRRAITDSPDAAVGPPMVARVIDGDGNASLAVVGGNNRQWAMQNLGDDQRQATLDYSNAKAQNFGLGAAPDGDSQIVRFLGTYDFRKPGDEDRLQGMVDALNPSPGMVQSTAKRAEIDAANLPLAELGDMDMEMPPGEAQSAVRGLIARGMVDRNRLAATASSGSQSQDYVQRLLVNAAFQQPSIAEARNDARSGNGTMRGLIDAATPALISLRKQGASEIADAISRAFSTTLDVTKNQGLDKLPQALAAVAAQQEMDPAHAPAQAVAQALQKAIVTDKAGRVQPDATIANAREIFGRIDRAVQHHQGGADLFGESRSLADTIHLAAGAGVPANEDNTTLQEEPDQLYHGSPEGFQHFEHTQRNDYGYFGKGVYLTDKPWRAETYAGANGHVYQVRTTATRLADSDQFKAAWKQAAIDLHHEVHAPAGWTATLKRELPGYPEGKPPIRTWEVRDAEGKRVTEANGANAAEAISSAVKSTKEYADTHSYRRSALASKILQEQGYHGVRAKFSDPEHTETVIFDPKHVQITDRRDLGTPAKAQEEPSSNLSSPGEISEFVKRKDAELLRRIQQLYGVDEPSARKIKRGLYDQDASDSAYNAAERMVDALGLTDERQMQIESDPVTNGFVPSSRFPISNIIDETDPRTLTSSIVNGVRMGADKPSLAESHFSTIAALMQAQKVGVTWSDIARYIDDFTTRNAGSVSSKASLFGDIATKVRSVANQYGIQLKPGELGSDGPHLESPQLEERATESEYAKAADQVRDFKGAIPPRAPTADERAAIIKAYQAHVQATGFPAVRIADVMEGAGLPLGAKSKAALMGLYKSGDVVNLSSGDWSLADNRARAWGVNARAGEPPALMMRMASQHQPAVTPPGTARQYLDAKGVTDPAKQADFIARQQKLDKSAGDGDASLSPNRPDAGPVPAGGGGSEAPVGGSGGGSDLSGYYLPPAKSGGASAGVSTPAQRAEVLRHVAQGTATPAEIQKAFAEGQTISSIDRTLVQEPQLGLSLRGAKVAKPEDVARLFQGILRNPYKEVLRVLKVQNGEIQASEILHVGALTASIADAGEIIRFMQRTDGDGTEVIISHNHPSGDPTPSSADTRATNQIHEALKRAGYALSDHVITNHGRYFSMFRGGEGRFAAGAAPWELVSRNDLRKAERPQDFRAIAETLRTGDPDAVHVVYLTTKMGLTAIERQPAVQTLPDLAKGIMRTAAREGSYGVVLSFPKAATEPKEGENAEVAQMRRVQALSNLLKDAGGPKLIDVNSPDLPSAAAAGLMEKHAKLVLDTEDARQSLREEPENYSGLQIVDDKGSPYANVPLTGLAQIKIIQMPELVQLSRELTGQLPELKRMPKARGQFAPIGNGRVRLDPRIFSDPLSAAKTLAHEIGHLAGWLPSKVMARGNLHGWLHSLNKFMQDRFGAAAISNKDLRAELIALTKYWKPYDPATAPKKYVQYRESAAELYADAVSVLFNTPATLKDMAPKFYAEFFRGLDTKPEVKAAFFDMQRWLNRPMMQVLKDRATKADQMFAKAQEIFETKWKEREERYKGFGGWLSRLKQGFFDAYSPIVDREAKAGTSHAQDAARFLFDEHPMADNHLYRWLERMQRTVVQPAEGSGFSMDDIGRQLFFHRIANERYAISGRIAEQMGVDTGGRSVIANPQGHTPQTARMQLLAERLENGIRGQTLLDHAVQRFHDMVYDVMRDAHDAGMLTNEQMALIKGNRDNYATFTPLEYVDVKGSTGMQVQAGTLKEIQNPFVSTVTKALAMIRASQLNRVKTTAVRVLARDWPAEIQRAETVRGADGREIPRAPREKGIEQIMLREAGKPAWYNVPKEIALMFEHSDIPLLQSAMNMLSVPFQKFFHPLFIEFNPVFQLMRHPIRNTRRNFVNAPQGVGFWDIARQIPLIKSIGPNPVLDAARDFVRKGVQQPLIAEMLDNLAITPGDAMFGVTPARPVNSFDRLLQQTKVLPAEGGHQTWVENLLPNRVVKVLKSIQMAGRINEIVPKASVYQILTDRLGWTPQEAAFYVRNYIGTPNYNKKGKHIGLVNTVYPFVNIWMRGWQADIELARKGYQRRDQPGSTATTPASWWFRWSMTNGIWTVLKVAAALGVLGAATKKLFDGISDHYKANYDIIPLGTTGQGDYGPKVAFVPIPKDPVDRIMSGVLYNVLMSSGKLAAQNGLLGADLQQANPPDGTGVGTMLQHNTAQIDSDVPGLNPMLKLAAGWRTYLQGQNPVDDFRGQPVLSDAQYLAGGLDGLKPMLTWSYGQTGMSNFLSFDPKLGMTLEQLKNLPMISGMVKITDAGYHEQQMAQVALDKAAEARMKLDMPSNAQRLATEYSTLQRLGDKYRTDEQTERFNELKGWYQSVYRPAEASLRDGKDNGMTDTERQATLQSLKSGSSEYERKP